MSRNSAKDLEQQQKNLLCFETPKQVFSDTEIYCKSPNELRKTYLKPTFKIGDPIKRKSCLIHPPWFSAARAAAIAHRN